LLLSNLRNNKKLSFRSQSVQRYLQELLEQVTHNIIKKCAINVSCPTDFEMTVDWKLFHEAFRSVVENAVKYSPDGGTVEIEASCNESGPSFRITDHGNGIDPSVKDKIFDEFYSQHIENHSKGTALSLAIAREIMTLHLGTLNVDSELGQGASFLFTLPPNTLSS
ncbi:MAG: ATP-binding protein, partial [Proteobacteria bacterium]|nr:ATP-binding protein [Pseudomonadota bacterium]